MSDEDTIPLFWIWVVSWAVILTILYGIDYRLEIKGFELSNMFLSFFISLFVTSIFSGNRFINK